MKFALTPRKVQPYLKFHCTASSSVYLLVNRFHCFLTRNYFYSILADESASPKDVSELLQEAFNNVSGTIQPCWLLKMYCQRNFWLRILLWIGNEWIITFWKGQKGRPLFSNSIKIKLIYIELLYPYQKKITLPTYLRQSSNFVWDLICND